MYDLLRETLAILCGTGGKPSVLLRIGSILSLLFISFQLVLLKKEIRMDKTGVASLVIGIILLALGGWGVWAYLPNVIVFVKGIIGIIGILIGIFLIIFGVLMIRE